MLTLVLSEGGMDVSRDPGGELQGAVGVFVRRLLSEAGLTPTELELGFFARFPAKTKVRGFRERVALTINDVSRSRTGIGAVVVVIDADGHGPKRLKDLQQGRADADAAGATLAARTSVGVAVEMVEAWLLGDHNAVARLFNRKDGGKDPEGHSDPKAVLAGWIREAGSDTRESYKTLAEQADLDTVESRCKSFKKFRTDIAEYAAKA